MIMLVRQEKLATRAARATRGMMGRMETLMM
jgi:hypothetical protein